MQMDVGSLYALAFFIAIEREFPAVSYSRRQEAR